MNVENKSTDDELKIANLRGVKEGLSQAIKIIEAHKRRLEAEKREMDEDPDRLLSRLAHFDQLEALEKVREEILEKFKNVFSSISK